MSGRRFFFLSVGAALLALVILSGGVWLILRQDSAPQITLPEPLPPDLWYGLNANSTPPGAPYAVITLSPSRARDILLGLRQPTAYSMTVQTTLHWENGFQVKNHQWYARDGLYRVETKDESGQIQVQLFTEGSLYRWKDGDPYYHYRQSPLEGLRPEELIGTPALDTLLGLQEERLKSVEYMDASRLRFTTNELYYQGEYIVSLEEGILVLARYTDENGDTVYQSVTTKRQLDTPPSAELFLLPDGQPPE